MPTLDKQLEDHASAAFCPENVAFLGNEDEVLAIARRGPRGAALLAGLSVLVLLAIWISFFFFIFVPRGGVG
jgi:hypothetical protein